MQGSRLTNSIEMSFMEEVSVYFPMLQPPLLPCFRFFDILWYLKFRIRLDNLGICGEAGMLCLASTANCWDFTYTMSARSNLPTAPRPDAPLLDSLIVPWCRIISFLKTFGVVCFAISLSPVHGQWTSPSTNQVLLTLAQQCWRTDNQSASVLLIRSWRVGYDGCNHHHGLPKTHFVRE